MGALKLAFATDVVDPYDRFDLWHEVACKAYAERVHDAVSGQLRGRHPVGAAR